MPGGFLMDPRKQAARILPTLRNIGIVPGHGSPAFKTGIGNDDLGASPDGERKDDFYQVEA